MARPPVRSNDDPVEVSWFNDIRDNLAGVADVETITGADTLDDDNYVVLCNGTFTVSLPSVTTLTDNKVYIIKNIGAGVITVDATAAETIDGAGSVDLGIQYESLTIVSDGSSAWYVTA